MPTAQNGALILYVDRSTEQWVVLDREGALWSLPATGTPWADRRPFCPNDETVLELVPGHYKFMIGISS